jgi:hypothetical protein
MLEHCLSYTVPHLPTPPLHVSTLSVPTPDASPALALPIKDAPAFDFYPERFWYAVEGWSEGEICRYWRLLGHQWMRGALPASEDDLAALARGKVTPRILEKFPIGSDGRRRNAVMESVRNDQRARRHANAEKARHAAGARWKDRRKSSPPAVNGSSPKHSTSNAPSIPQAMLEQCPPITHHPYTNNNNNNEGAAAPLPSPLLEDCLKLADGAKITETMVHLRHRARYRVGWKVVQGGVALPIVDPVADLEHYAESWRFREAKSESGKKKKGGGGKSPVDLRMPAEGEPLFPVLGKLVAWLAYKRERGKGYKPRGWEALLTHLTKFSPSVVASTIDRSMASNWDGLFPEREGGPEKKKGAGMPERPQKVLSDPSLAEPAFDWRKVAEGLYSPSEEQRERWKSLAWYQIPETTRAELTAEARRLNLI